MNDKEFIGKQIYNVRIEKGIQQKELANLIGRSQSSFSNREAGRYTFTARELKIICDYLQISMQDLMDGKPVSSYDKNINK